MLIRWMLNFLFGYKAVNVYYQCLVKQQYVTVTITQYRYGCRLRMGNGYSVDVWGKSCGTFVSSGDLYGYIEFAKGVLIFGNNAHNEETHFGWKVYTVREEINAFCNYSPYSEVAIKEKILQLQGHRDWMEVMKTPN